MEGEPEPIVTEETISKEEAACGSLLFKDFCANMTKLEKMRTYDLKMSTLFNEGLRSMMCAEADRTRVKQSLFPLVRLLIPINDNARKKYGLKQATVASTYIEALHLNPSSADAQRLKFWKNPSKLSGDLATKTSGDLGEVLQDVLKTRISVENSILTIKDINNILDELAAASGTAQTAIIRKQILNILSPVEQKWLMRIVFQDLKIGLKYENVLKWLNPNALQRYNECTDLRQICREIASGALSSSGDGDGGGIISRGISLFTCFQPMLAKGFTNSSQINEVESCMNKHPFVMDVKLDGERMLCHVSKKSGELRKGIFWTRNGNDYSSTYQSLLDDIIENVQCEACILDGEVCAWEESTQQFIPFGQNRTIAKYEQASQIEKLESEVSSGSRLVYVLFDILYLEGLRDSNGKKLRRDQWSSITDYEHIIPGGLQALQAEEAKEACRVAYGRDNLKSSDILHLPLLARRALLAQAVQMVPTRIQTVKSVSVYTSSIPDRKRQIENYFNKVTSEREEGLVVKDLLSPYVLGLKSRQLKHWVKMKPEYSDMTRDLDMIILGAYYGEGKSMRGKGLSTFLCGVRDNSSRVTPEENDGATDVDVIDMKFKTVCKIGTGYSFMQLEELRGKLAPVVQQWDKTSRNFKPPHFCTWAIGKTDDIPDVWVPPENSIVVELKCAQLVLSSDFSAGITCRFPRLRKIRYDKDVCEVMTDDDLKEVVELPRMNISEAVGREGTNSKSKKRATVKRKGGLFNHSESLVSSQYLVPKPAGRHQKLVSIVFQGKMFCIIEGLFSLMPSNFAMRNNMESPLLKYATKKNDYKLTRLQVIEIVQLNGGDVVANPMPNCFVIVGDKRTMQTKSLIDSGKNDVLSFQYIVDAINGFISDDYCNPNPSHFLGYTTETRSLFSGIFDEFGDSYTDASDEAHMKSIFDRLDDTIESLRRKRGGALTPKRPKRAKKSADTVLDTQTIMDKRVDETLQLSKRLDLLNWREIIESGLLESGECEDILDSSKWNTFWRSNVILYLDMYDTYDQKDIEFLRSPIGAMTHLGLVGQLFRSDSKDPPVILESLNPSSTTFRSLVPELILHGATVSPTLNEKVTHVVVDNDNNYSFEREQALQARLRDLRMKNDYRHEKRVVNVHWVKDCLAQKTLLLPSETHIVDWKVTLRRGDDNS